MIRNLQNRIPEIKGIDVHSREVAHSHPEIHKTMRTATFFLEATYSHKVAYDLNLQGNFRLLLTGRRRLVILSARKLQSYLRESLISKDHSNLNRIRPAYIQSWVEGASGDSLRQFLKSTHGDGALTDMVQNKNDLVWIPHSHLIGEQVLEVESPDGKMVPGDVHGIRAPMCIAQQAHHMHDYLKEYKLELEGNGVSNAFLNEMVGCLEPHAQAARAADQEVPDADAEGEAPSEEEEEEEDDENPDALPAAPPSETTSAADPRSEPKDLTCTVRASQSHTDSQVCSVFMRCTQITIMEAVGSGRLWVVQLGL